MSGGMDLDALRELVGSVLNDFAALWRHQDIGVECERLGLPEPPPEGECSKRVRVARSLAALPDAGLPSVAERIVSGTMPLSSGPAARFAIEDVLWAGRGFTDIPKKTRREIARDLDRVLDVLTRKADRFMALLERPVARERQPARFLRPRPHEPAGPDRAARAPQPWRLDR